MPSSTPRSRSRSRPPSPHRRAWGSPPRGRGLSLYYNTRETARSRSPPCAIFFRYLPVACRDGQSSPRASGCPASSTPAAPSRAQASATSTPSPTPRRALRHSPRPCLRRDASGRARGLGQPSIPLPAWLPHRPHRHGERAVGFSPRCALNASLGIPDRFDGIRGEDLPRMAAWAAAEANPSTPSPSCTIRRFRRVPSGCA